jgi:cobalt-precorrin-6B (C15)-methyltransferase
MNREIPASPPKGGPTKDEVLAISLFKLGLLKNDVFADLGCGTGKVSVNAAPLVQKVHAVDIRKEACSWTENEVKKQEIPNISVHLSENNEFISSLDHLDAAFIGGSQGISDVIDTLAELRTRTVVINAVMLETVSTSVKALRDNGMFKEVISVQISRSYPIGAGIMFKPIDPVFIICGGI